MKINIVKVNRGIRDSSYTILQTNLLTGIMPVDI